MDNSVFSHINNILKTHTQNKENIFNLIVHYPEKYSST